MTDPQPIDPIPEIPANSIQEPLSDDPSPSKGLAAMTQPIDKAELRKQIELLIDKQTTAVTLAGKAYPKVTRETLVDDYMQLFHKRTTQAVTAVLQRVDEGLPDEVDCDEPGWGIPESPELAADQARNYTIRHAHQAITNELSKFKEAE